MILQITIVTKGHIINNILTVLLKFIGFLDISISQAC